MRVAAQQFYDAVFDDEAFNQLPGLIAQALGSRSCVIHWRAKDGEADILSHSGYYSDENMALYAASFAEHDLWTQAAFAPERVNRVWNAEQFVPASEYRRSIFFNEWIRGMGDDTFHCLGSVMETGWGHGIIGLHRGRTQESFEPDQVKTLELDIVHLRRMLGFRGRLREERREKEQLATALDCLVNAIFILDPRGRLKFANAAGEQMLMSADGFAVRSGRLEPIGAPAAQRFRAALAKAADRHSPEATALLVPRKGKPPFQVSLIGTTSNAAHQVTVHVGIRAAANQTSEPLLRNIYGLSAAEANVATRLADGGSIESIACERDTTVNTVRSQIKAVMRKLDCDRQAGIVQIVATLPGVHGR